MFTTASTIESVSTRADNTLKIVCGSQELSPEHAAELFALKGRLGWFVFSENVIGEKDLPKEQAPEFKGDRSPSKRLKNILFVFWNTKTSRKTDFETFYREWIEKKIKEIKDTLA